METKNNCEIRAAFDPDEGAFRVTKWTLNGRGWGQVPLGNGTDYATVRGTRNAVKARFGKGPGRLVFLTNHATEF